MILYIICFLILIILSFFIFIKIKYKFWSIQPVFHYYDLHYWLRPCGIINYDLPSFNKYINISNITTENVININSTYKQKIINFIKNNYLNNEVVKYFLKYH